MRATIAVLSVWSLVVGGSAAFPVASEAPVDAEQVVVVFHDDVADPGQAAREIAGSLDATLGFV